LPGFSVSISSTAMASLPQSFCMDADLEEVHGRDTRGWAMRRGHCRRLKAECGRESTRGRAAYARSLNRVNRFHPNCGDHVRSKHWRYEHALDAVDCWSVVDDDWSSSGEEETIEAFAALSCSDFSICKEIEDTEVSTQPPDEQTGGDTEEEEEEPHQQEVRSEEHWADEEVQASDRSAYRCLGPAPRLQRTRSSPCTASEVACAVDRVASAIIPLHLWKMDKAAACPVKTASVRKKVPYRWDQAMALADSVADAKLFSGCEAGHRCRRKSKPGDKADATPDNSAFGKLQGDFLRAHGEEIRAALVNIWGPSVHLKPIALAADAAKQFVEAHGCVKGAELRATLHGTDVKNHGSIFQRGLLVPGSSPGVCVKHGLCHGAGIYSATLRNASLAAGFCNVPQIMVCGVLDDTIEVPPRRCGNFYIHRESSAVRYVGDAIVAFDPARIAPLFLATAHQAPAGSFSCTFASLHGPTARAFVPAAPVVTQQINRGQISEEVEPRRHERKQAALSRCSVRPEVPAAVAFLSRRAAQRRR
jgi:hypothetical protein